VRQLKGLPPEILLISLPGHTKGHAGIAVRTASGWLVHAGDAYYDRRQMDAHPTMTTGMRVFQWMAHGDHREARRTEGRLRTTTVGDPTIQVLCAHDAGERITTVDHG
jgi:glyoxylase-like metal-dependent hydrolase (beta-lactamase superfamily II)